MSPTPWRSSSLMIAVPAAPAPETTTRTSSSRLPTTRRALVSAASTQIAVPCWSSWKTGMSSTSRSLASISKQRGAAMSSRLMPPYAGAIALTIETISSVSWVSSTTGQASTPPNRLNSAALPSITGIAAAGPMLPSPSTAAAVGDHGDGVALDGQPAGVRRVLGDGHADPGHAGGVRPGQLVAVAQGDLRRHLDLPAEVQQEGAVGDLAHLDPVQRPRAPWSPGRRGWRRRCRRSRRRRRLVGSESTTSRAVTMRAGLSDAGGDPANRGCVGGDRDPDRDGKPGAG